MTSKTKRVLLAWELGAGLGHAQRLLIAARALLAAGWQPVVATRQLSTLTTAFTEAGVMLIQAPMHKSLWPSGKPFRAVSYGDIIAVAGYGAPVELQAAVTGWEGLIELVAPEVIVSDHSPLLALAAYGRVPVVTLGDGFVIPPFHLSRFPYLRGKGRPLFSEERLMRNVADLQGQRRLATPPSLPVLVAGNAQVVCTYPELDVYRSVRDKPATGPLAATTPPLPLAQKEHLFVYLAADFPGTRKVLQAVVDSGASASAFIRGAPPALIATLERHGVSVHRSPPALEEALDQASVVLHHGGIGTSEKVLSLGRAQLLLPRHLEQTLNAGMLERLEVARVFPAALSLEQATRTIVTTLGNCALAMQANKVAREMAERPQGNSMAALLSVCERLRASPELVSS